MCTYHAPSEYRVEIHGMLKLICKYEKLQGEWCLVAWSVLESELDQAPDCRDRVSRRLYYKETKKLISTAPVKDGEWLN